MCSLYKQSNIIYSLGKNIKEILAYKIWLVSMNCSLYNGQIHISFWGEMWIQG